MLMQLVIDMLVELSLEGHKEGKANEEDANKEPEPSCHLERVPIRVGNR